MNVLITDGDNRSSLAVTRSLGRKGHRIYVSAPKEESLASCSCHCTNGFAVPDPLCHRDSYLTAVLELVKRKNIDVIFPMTEQSIYLLNSARNRFPDHIMLACPNQTLMEAVSDKSALFKLAERLQVAIPKTFHLTGSDDLAPIIDLIDHYPVVVKSAFSRILVQDGFLTGGISYASSRTELEKVYAEKPVLRYPSLIQEKINGSGTGLFTLFDEKRHLVLFSHKRLREKPPSGGVSVVSESVRLDDEMVSAADRLLSSVGFSGVAMVEFKRDQRDGRAKLMEINGRFWGSLQLAIACGVDFPNLYLDFLQGKVPSSPLRDYKLGHKLKWFYGTLDHLLIRFKYSKTKQNLSSDAASRWRALIDFLKIREQNTSFDVFDSSDFGPFWFETKKYFAEALKRGK